MCDWNAELKTPWWTPTYGWPDFYVVEVDGKPVACAGLWDRGRDVREVWHHPASGVARTSSVTNLLDFGFAAGHEASMTRLLGFLLGRTHTLGRDALAAPLQHHPEILDTRGQILAKQGRTKEAIASLESSLKLLKRPATHEKLAELYELLGEKGLAEAHRRMALEKP